MAHNDRMTDTDPYRTDPYGNVRASADRNTISPVYMVVLVVLVLGLLYWAASSFWVSTDGSAVAPSSISAPPATTDVAPLPSDNSTNPSLAPTLNNDTAPPAELQPPANGDKPASIQPSAPDQPAPTPAAPAPSAP